MEVTHVEECYGAKWGYEDLGNYINEAIVYLYLKEDFVSSLWVYHSEIIFMIKEGLFEFNSDFYMIEWDFEVLILYEYERNLIDFSYYDLLQY